MHPKINANECPIQEFLRIKRVDFEGFPEKYLLMAKKLGMKDCSLRRSVPNVVNERWQSAILSKLQECLVSEKDEQYLKNLENIKKVLSLLKPALIDIDKISKINESTKNRLHTLTTNAKSFHEPIEYSNSGSVTGRLTITSGPNVLTMPAEYKRLLKSRFDNGRILQIDLIAAEPTIALNVANKAVIEDPYTALAESVFQSKLDRNACKRIVLCSLYGQSKRKLSEALGSSINVDTAIKSTRKYFDYDGILQSIRESIEDGNVMRNFFGRPIILPDSSDSIAISYFLQSTAAEAAILAFGDLLNRTSEHCVPLHVIHDAIVIDCKEDYANFLTSKEMLRLKLNNWTLPAKVSLIN
jgi:hypothetical protein